jgi:hypothetical protein
MISVLEVSAMKEIFIDLPKENTLLDILKDKNRRVYLELQIHVQK